MLIHKRGCRHKSGIKDYEEAGMPILEMEDGCPQDARKEGFQSYKQALEESEKDKYGVVIAEEKLDFGIVEVGTFAAEPTRVIPFNLTLEEEGTMCLMEARMSLSVGSNAGLREGWSIKGFHHVKYPDSFRYGDDIETDGAAASQTNADIQRCLPTLLNQPSQITSSCTIKAQEMEEQFKTLLALKMETSDS
ncbi:hypothetical protein FRB96_008432 [Tulasnella sp. 330]|nr:hypothetical protein FRB96_008432 [Tulasnella sp. 330]